MGVATIAAMSGRNVVVFVLTKAIRTLCHWVPRTLIRLSPPLASGLYLGHFYIFAQALGLLWTFGVSLLAAMAMQLVAAVCIDADGKAGLVVASLTAQPLRALAVTFTYFAVCRVIILFSSTMWTVMWETYHGYPTLRIMLLGRHFGTMANGTKSDKLPGASTSSNPLSPNGDVPKFERQITPPDCFGEKYADRRILVLTTPLVILLVLNVCMLVGQAVCEGHIDDRCLGMSCFNPTARVNRILRFVLFVAMLQWFQAWTALFPMWHEALLGSKSRGGMLVSWTLLFGLTPASLLRFSAWLVWPAGTGQSQQMFGFRHFFVDAVLVTCWTFWLLVASSMLLDRGNLCRAGFSLCRIADESVWQILTGSLKFTLVVWQMVSFVRGCAKLGFAHAQSDWIFSTILYPWLLALTWTITFVLVAITRSGVSVPLALAGIAFGTLASNVAAFAICSFAGRGEHPLLVCIVGVYMGRQLFHLVRGLRRSRKDADSIAVPAGEPDGSAEKPSKSSSRRNNGSVDFSVPSHDSSATERSMAGAAVRTMILICFTFVSVLTGCVLLGGLQQRTGLMLDDVMSWNSIPGGIEIINSHVSRMILLQKLNTSSLGAKTADPAELALPPGTTPRYAVCGHAWHGLSLLDYALLAHTSYFSPTEKNDLPALFRLLMPHKNISVWAPPPLSSRRWLELRVTTCAEATSAGSATDCPSVTIIAISGTDPSRFTDYAENLRMWTEPVSLQILSTLFPTVRTWPRDTTGEWISLMHDVMRSMAIQDNRWHYQEILEHVRQKPADEVVVLTGHSLGGGMALVVGGLTGRLAVALQPPGVFHSMAKHQTHNSASGRETGDTAVHQKSVTLKFEGDWVQHFDEHGGLVQTMSCDRSHQGVQLACHMLEGAVCHLLRHCGDADQRFASCSHEYAPDSAVRVIILSLWASLKRNWRASSWRFLDAYRSLGPALHTALCVSVVAGVRQGYFAMLRRRLAHEQQHTCR